MFVEEKQQGEVKELDAPSKLLLKGADLLEQRGWCQKALEWDGAMCVMGVMQYADYGDINNWGSETYWEARSRMCKAIGENWVKWNNTEGRTAAEVIAKLRAVAFSS